MRIDKDKLIKARSDANYTQQQLAEKIGITTTTLSRLERGIGSPHMSTIKAIASTLKIKVKELILKK